MKNENRGLSSLGCGEKQTPNYKKQGDSVRWIPGLLQEVMKQIEREDAGHYEPARWITAETNWVQQDILDMLEGKVFWF